ncbi:hypothetical protein [Streptomyces iranensis]|uniref:hypothetical protein n=1 Tax=Streptomyces iranensis TaxID=576784 RepID=UPI0039B77C02
MGEQDVGVGAVAARRVERGAGRAGQEPAHRGAQCGGRLRDLLHLGDGGLLGAVRRRGRQQRRYVYGGDVLAQCAVGEVGGLVQPAQQPLPDQAEVRAELHPQRVPQRGALGQHAQLQGRVRVAPLRYDAGGGLGDDGAGDPGAQRVRPRRVQVGAAEPPARRAQGAPGLPHGGEVRVVPRELGLPGRVVGVVPGDGGGQGPDVLGHLAGRRRGGRALPARVLAQPREGGGVPLGVGGVEAEGPAGAERRDGQGVGVEPEPPVAGAGLVGACEVAEGRQEAGAGVVAVVLEVVALDDESIPLLDPGGHASR